MIVHGGRGAGKGDSVESRADSIEGGVAKSAPGDGDQGVLAGEECIQLLHDEMTARVVCPQVLTKLFPRGYTDHSDRKNRRGKCAEGSDFEENSLAS